MGCRRCFSPRLYFFPPGWLHDCSPLSEIGFKGGGRHGPALGFGKEELFTGTESALHCWGRPHGIKLVLFPPQSNPEKLVYPLGMHSMLGSTVPWDQWDPRSPQVGRGCLGEQH